MKSFLIVMSVALVGGGGTFVIRNLSNAASRSGVPGEALYTVERGKLTVTITENGSLMAKNSEKINFAGRRPGKITFLVEEGKTVAEGEVICKLDTTDLEKQIQRLERLRGTLLVIGEGQLVSIYNVSRSKQKKALRGADARRGR